MRPGVLARVAVSAVLATSLLACGGRGVPAVSADAASVDVASVDAAAQTTVGLACASSTDCAGLACLGVLERACAGPVRPHTWRVEFPGGSCGPAPELASGGLASPCPPGSITWTAFVGCDGVPFRFCARRCRGDDDCRTGEGYRCAPEMGACAPPAFVTPPDDAGP